MPYQFNPFTGTLDIVPATTTSAPAVPTLTATALTVPANTQLLFSRSIVLDVGGSISVGINAALIHVS